MKLREFIASHQKSADPLSLGGDRAWVIEEAWLDGQLVATKICSAPLESHLWLLHDPDYYPPDDDPVFFEDELVVLKTKTLDELKSVLKVKVVYPRCRVVQ